MGCKIGDRVRTREWLYLGHGLKSVDCAKGKSNLLPAPENVVLGREKRLS